MYYERGAAQNLCQLLGILVMVMVMTDYNKDN